MTLQERIDDLYQRPAPEDGDWGDEFRDAFEELKHRLNRGEVRAAEPDGDGWRVNAWVKKGILLGFRVGRLRDYSLRSGDEDGSYSLRGKRDADDSPSPAAAAFPFFDKDTFPLKEIGPDDGVRVVPGGSAVRDGVYLGRGVVCMPPMYANVGAYVDDGTMIDSHALVGSCAQVGKRVHLSAAAQLGGVLEPVGSRPVIVEDDVLVGGNCGIYEGTLVRRGAILGSGTILNASVPVYDLVRETVYRATPNAPLEIPADAVVVPGSRAVSSFWGRAKGLSVHTPVVVKYRDDETDRSVRLEDVLR